MSAPQRSNSAGFSLIELLVALTIFAIIAVIAQRGMVTAMVSADRLGERGSELAELQLAVTSVTRDLENAVPRAIRTGSGQMEAAFLLEDGGRTLIFTRAGLNDPTGRARSPFERVIYTAGASTDDAPQRGTWDHVDRPEASTPRLAALGAEIRAIEFAVLSEGSWQSSWPLTDDAGLKALPEGIAVTFETDRWGPIRRVVAYP
ncbi:MAG: type II secretion system minor pseudopilin GspJ [Pseudomonadota bacterium]